MSERKIVLPVAVTVALFVALIGIRIPDSFRLIKNKQSPRAVFEVQAKEIKEGLDKSGQFFTPGGYPASFAPIVFSIVAFRHEARSNGSTITTSAPARASPISIS